MNCITKSVWILSRIKPRLSAFSGRQFSLQATEKMAQILKDKHLNGKNLEHFTDDKLSSMGLTLREVLDVKQTIARQPKKTEVIMKTFHDPVHSNMQFHPACVAIINTPQFQRLRYLKQLSLVYHIYPGAAHNRFEHSLGVCHLAGKFVRQLRETHKDLGITDVDQLCVEIAGLCHDLGHGPYSHLFDNLFLRKLGIERKHEMASVDMLNHLIQEKGLMVKDEKDKEKDGILRKHGITEQDIVFIQELIAGPKSEHLNKEWPYQGRGPEKAYLYEIVANQRNGVDVDKWEYIARDCFQIGLKNNFDYTRFIMFARVVAAEDKITGDEQKTVQRMQICTRDKETINLCNMFATRYMLHKVAYKHEDHGALEIMMTECLVKANDHVKIRGAKGTLLKMSECINDMVAYTKLTDNIIFKIQDFEIDVNNEQQLKDMTQAQNILKRIYSWDLFRCVHKTPPLKPKQLSEQYSESANIKEKILEIAKQEGEMDITEDSFYIQVVHLDYGSKKGSSKRSDDELSVLEKVNVYSKFDLASAKPIKKDEVSRILAPDRNREIIIRIYTTAQDKTDDDKYKKWFVKADIEQNEPPQRESQNGH